MTTKEEMLEAIQEEIWDKTLSFGCCIKFHNQIYKIYEFFTDKDWINISAICDNISIYLCPEDIQKIIWHPVMLWDVLDYGVFNLSSNKYDELVDKIATFYCNPLWEHKRKPINDQSINCIEYIYNLIK